MQCDKYEDLVGKRLLHNIENSKGMLLIPADTILSDSHIGKLENFKIDLFDIHVEFINGEGDAESEESGEAAVAEQAAEIAVIEEAGAVNTSQLVKRTDAKLQEIERIIRDTGKIPVTDVEEHVLPAIMEATDKRNIYKLFSEWKAEGDTRFKHSIGVAYISTILGRWLQMDEQELALLTIAASLCDIGMIQLPAALQHKTSELEPGEEETLKQHTTLGYELLKQSGLDPRVALVALQHHEREDGSGYPSGLKGSEIDRFSKIVGLADIYVTMTTDLPHRKSLPFYQVINELYADIVRNRLDSVIGLTFLNRLMSAQIGSDIILSDDRKGKIVLINANYPTSPLIALGQEFIDLSKNDAVKIKEIVG